jgi:hypothetical protein
MALHRTGETCCCGRKTISVDRTEPVRNDLRAGCGMGRHLTSTGPLSTKIVKGTPRFHIYDQTARWLQESCLNWLERELADSSPWVRVG